MANRKKGKCIVCGTALRYDDSLRLWVCNNTECEASAETIKKQIGDA